MTDARETVPCRLCGKPTPMTGTKLCDRHWELEGRVLAEPDMTRRILASHTGEAEPVADAREQDYPPLPEAPIIGTSRFGSIFRGHSDAAMRAYVDADRAARKPLTDEQITDAIESHFSETHEWPEGDIEIARVIERAHGIKE